MKRSLLGFALLAVACRNDTPGVAASPAAPSSTENPTARVKLAPSLLESGRVRVERVNAMQLSSELRVAGEVRPGESGSAEAGTLVAGRVSSFEVGEGAHVKRGQVLAWVDAPEVARAAADLLLARAHAAVAARKRTRQETLDASSATSQNALDDARAEDEAARAQLLAARTLLTSLGGAEPPSAPDATTLVVRVPVRAPIAGIVAERRVVLGGAVSPDTALFRIVSDTSLALSVWARVPETAGTLPSPGTTASISARADAVHTCEGIVAGSSGGVDPATRTLPVRLTPGKGCSWLVAGSFVDVAFTGAAGRSAAATPRTAVVDVRGKPTVFVAGPSPGEFEARVVEVGPGDATHVSVETGVAPGDTVAVEGALLLKGELLRAELEGTP